MRVYCMYFPFFIPKAEGKRSAVQSKAIYSEFPYYSIVIFSVTGKSLRT